MLCNSLLNEKETDMTYTLTNDRGQILDTMMDVYGRNLLALWIKANRRLGVIVKIGGAA